jgi:hypothetical protein
VAIDIEGVALRGDPNVGTDTLVTRFTKRSLTIPNRPDTTMARFLYVIKSDSTTEDALLIVTATDSSGNKGADTTTIRLSAGPKLTINAPTAGATSSIGKSITIQIKASDPQGVRVVGWRTSGVLTRADSIIIGGSALPDTVVFTDTLTIPSGTATGNLTITGFAVDSTGDPSSTAAGVTITVASAASDVTPPLVTFTVTPRLEVDDSITVHATDASGITRIGFVVRPEGSTAVVAADSVTFSGNQTDITTRLRLKLDTVSTYPRLLTVEAFAVDSIGNRGLSSATGTPIAGNGVANKDTVTVVAGKTFPLPNGGQIGDAVYSKNRNELYLTNLLLNRLEVFNVGSSSFLAGGIQVGSRPLGLALWPRDTLGNYGDTVIVANSGGTNLSIVDVLNRVERRRHRLPNYLVEKVKTAIDPNNSAVVVNITQFDFSDRPQYVGAVCRGGTGCPGGVVAVYSTTPTPGQSNPDKGYLAWENLDTTAAPLTRGHFFWELAVGPASLATDTLQIIAVRDPAPGVLRRDTILGGAVGIMADFNQLTLQDTTYVRNSGDFNHAVMGEGGGTNVSFARAFAFDSRVGLTAIAGTGCSSGNGALLSVVLSCSGQEDRGVSPGIYVRDFISNRSSRVFAVATNFNGRTNFIRADSIYVMDYTLRQAGLLQIGGSNPGMDVHPSNTFDATTRGSSGVGGNGNPNSRLIYAARPDPNISVFDSYWYGEVAQIPVRDAIIGPIRLALDALGQQVLVGVTANGIVVVPLTTPIANPFPVRAAVRSH